MSFEVEVYVVGKNNFVIELNNNITVTALIDRVKELLTYKKINESISSITSEGFYGINEETDLLKNRETILTKMRGYFGDPRLIVTLQTGGSRRRKSRRSRKSRSRKYR